MTRRPSSSRSSAAARRPPPPTIPRAGCGQSSSPSRRNRRRRARRSASRLRKALPSPVKTPGPAANKVTDDAGQLAPAASGVPLDAPVVRTNELRALGLKKRYRTRVVVKDVSLEVRSGEVIGLLGPNGAGKTTCFYMMVGLVPMDGGDLFLNGTRLTHTPLHRRARLGLSYLPQEASIFRRLTVEENVQAVLELHNSDPDIIRERLDDLLRDLNVAHLRASLAISLSGGERRRVEIARALATQPCFILLDEPFAGVDPIAVLDIQKIIGFLKSRGIGVVITDHNVIETLGICDGAYLINDGTVLAYGKPDEIVYNESVRKVYLGEHFRL